MVVKRRLSDVSAEQLALYEEKLKALTTGIVIGCLAGGVGLMFAIPMVALGWRIARWILG